MIILLAAVIGAITGGLVARRRKGRGVDIAQYAAVYALIFALAALFALIFISRVAA